MKLIIKRLPEKTLLKAGRKTYAEITENPNPEYKFVLWLKGGGAISGFETEQKAIERAEILHQDWNDIINSIKTTQP